MAIWIDTSEDKEGNLLIHTRWHNATLSDIWHMFRGVLVTKYYGFKISNKQMIVKFKAFNRER